MRVYIKDTSLGDTKTIENEDKKMCKICEANMTEYTTRANGGRTESEGQEKGVQAYDTGISSTGDSNSNYNANGQ